VAASVAKQNLPLAGILALFLLAIISVEPLRRPRRPDRKDRQTVVTSRHAGRAGVAGAVAGTAIVTGTYAAMVANKGLPLTEGWFEVFAKYVNAGKVPYRDFDLLAPPLYTYILAGIARVFGYDLIVFRIVGVVVFMAIAIMACLVFSRLFAPWVAMVAACLTAFFMQSEVANIFYDYIRFFDLLAYGVCLCLLLHVLAGQPKRSRWSWALAACGLCSAGALLIRQNSGAVLIAAVVVVLTLLLFLAKGRTQRLIDLAVYVSALLAPLVILVAVMASNGSLRPFLRMTSGDALAAKGGMAVVLFGWVPRFEPQVLLVQGSIALLLGLLLINGTLYRLRPQRAGSRDDLLWGVVFFAAALAGVLLCLRSATVSSAFAPFRLLATPYSVCPVIGVLCAYALFRLAYSRALAPGQRRFFLGLAVLTFLILAIGYGAATSGGLSEGETALAIGTIFASILFLGSYVLARPAQAVTLTLCLGLCLSYVSFKIDAPYAWWGLREPSLRTATESLTLPLLRGIRVSPTTKAAVEGISNAITANSRPGDDVFVFPHIPIFYLLTNRYPRTFTLVQWFDFSSSSALATDMSSMDKRPPRVVVIAEVPDWVYAAHEQLFRGGQPSAQRSMRDGLLHLVQADHYREVGVWTLTDGYSIVVYATR
jgi:hypothetical protein